MRVEWRGKDFFHNGLFISEIIKSTFEAMKSGETLLGVLFHY